MGPRHPVSRVYAESGEVLSELHDGRNSQPVPYDQVPEVVVQAILAAEDSEFFEHEGVDFSAILSAAIDNLIYDTTRGGSTITQQVVKNAFVGSEVSIRRKVTEAFVSAELERRFPKERILEFYMNSVYFGSGAYGVQTAAFEFYGKELDELEVDEAATLAVLVRNPTLYNPRLRPEITLERRNDVIEQMREEGWISETQASNAIRQPLGVVESPLRRGEADHVVAEVTRQLLNDPDFAFLGATKEERKRNIFGCPADDVACEGGGGLEIHTTIDLGLQQEANRILNEWLPLPPYEENLAACSKLFDDFDENEAFYAKYAETHSCLPTGAITMVDNYTGAVRVMASGLPFEFSQFDLAIQGRRNPGSAFKPFALAAALEQKWALGHNWSGEDPIEIPCPFVCDDDGTPTVWEPSNYGGVSYGVMSMREATYRSVNTIYAQISAAVGPQTIADMARRMGITESVLNPVLSLVLGSSAVSTLEMASAYSNFATNGLHAENFLISKIVDHEGKVIYEHEVEVTQVAEPAVFAAARIALLDVPAIGTAARTFGQPDYRFMRGYVGGKTGTHQDHRDAWYVGFTPEFSTAVWVGYEAEQKRMEGIVINGQTFRGVTGGGVPAPIWAAFMAIVLAGREQVEYPADPANLREYLIPPATIVPVVVGLEQDEAEKLLRIEARLNVEVEMVNSLEPEGIVVSQDIEPGTEVSQGTVITIFVSNGETPVGPLPNLSGLTFEQALQVVQDFEMNTGVRLTLVSEKVEVKDASLVGKIVATNPPAGTQIEASAVVTVFIGELKND